MTVVLLILKITGIVLLSLLAVVLIVALLVLFVPVHYRLSGSYRDDFCVKVRVRWLCRLLVFGFDTEDSGYVCYLRIAGFKKKLQKADNTDDFEDTITETEKNTGCMQTDEISKAETVPDEISRGELTAQSLSVESGEDEQQSDEEHSDEEQQSGKSGGFFRRFSDGIQKIRDLYERVRQAVINIRTTAGRLKKMAGDARNRQAFGFVVSSLLGLLKKICPRKLKLHLTYSTGSPDTTGELLGVFSLFPVGYRNRWQIIPDFEADHFYADAEFDVGGRIFVFQILWCAFRIVLDKNCRRLYNQIRKVLS